MASDDIIEEVVRISEKADGVYGDVGFYSDDSFSLKRGHYSSKGVIKSHFSRGMMPAHPSFYVRRECYEKAGLYRTDF